MDRIQLAHNKVQWLDLGNVVKKPSGSKKLGSFSISCGIITFSKRALLHGVIELLSLVS
jgi:hypothetical protein